MKGLDVVTRTYEYDEDYRVDITIEGSEYHAYLYCKDRGHKMLMFGGFADQNSYEDFADMVEANVPDYIADLENEISFHEACNEAVLCAKWVGVLDYPTWLKRYGSRSKNPLEAFRKYRDSHLNRDYEITFGYCSNGKEGTAEVITFWDNMATIL